EGRAEGEEQQPLLPRRQCFTAGDDREQAVERSERGDRQQPALGSPPEQHSQHEHDRNGEHQQGSHETYSPAAGSAVWDPKRESTVEVTAVRRNSRPSRCRPLCSPTSLVRMSPVKPRRRTRRSPSSPRWVRNHRWSSADRATVADTPARRGASNPTSGTWVTPRRPSNSHNG